MEKVLEHPKMTEVTPLTKPRGKEFSLGAAAKELGVVKSTVRGAIKRGELRATKNTQGHYQIEAAALWQYKSNRESDQLKGAAGGAAHPKETVRRLVRDTGVIEGEEPSAVNSAPHRALGDSTHPPEKTINELLLERENQGLKDKVQTLEQHHAEYVKVTEMSLRLLPSPIKKEENTGQGDGKLWLNIAAVFVVVALAGTALYYRDNIGNTLAKFTVADDSTSVSIESEKPQG